MLQHLHPAQLLRLVTINRVLIRHGLDEVVLAIRLFRPVRFLLYLAPWNWFRTVPYERGERIRRALEDLGPIFIKFGQMVSTRRDLLPDDIAHELSRLQDRVPPFPNEEARAIIEKALGYPIETLFASFEATPMASASIAQVHGAVLHDGRRVVVKVLRPHIEKAIRRDVELMYVIAELAERYWPEGRRLRPVEVVREYEQTIIDELDLLREAANASQLRRNFEGSDVLYTPEVHWDYCRRNVMVMERIHGVPVSDVATLKARGVDLKLLAERGVEVFFTQVFRHNFFHADMHPGNVFIDATDPADPSYLAVDFGIVGTLSPADQRYLAENFYAFFNRDYARVAELHVESGWVPSDVRVADLEGAIRTVCEPIFEKPLKDISFGHVLVRLFQTARRFNMEVQPQLVLLEKTLLNIEGMGRDLYPELDLWQTARPFIQRWMDEQVGVRALVKGLRRNLPFILEKAPDLPGLIHETLRQQATADERQALQQAQLYQLQREIRASNRRTVYAVMGSALALGAVLLTSQSPEMPELLTVPWPAWVLGTLGLAFLLGAVWKRSALQES
ncbi:MULTISPECIES: ubiquinone biosynthesis regulatory protein kinase UbiB [unclassified Ectothiorhodospira]|uniref:ubiquinone biosynthesis regulatory protein kinase UbiB n=1 Tax=unclassified Ectothiorhodospira TaxID=2684909 RepID=UPI001EE7E0F2|nr:MULTISPECIES: ubiquinone biosynthesis regulatory protein kinase UbiB [unclassified Ectothiorhodospira]MCG5515936.1 ubiquinone biosynthesis regulatory protein kinase UbiB [Ectothiorhodospira sp. 9100]MCG5518461.1 ubiquinone biosynthesis regulatory protein kinase UbiB [Ectothiorhodospira sp. 9905]